MIAGRYSSDREIGRGGMGAVWLGRDEVLGRPVALKKIGMMPGAANPDLERAEREARLAARLNHPHVVAVYDLVADEDGHWLVMEYVEGVTLAALVKNQGALTPDEAAPMLEQAADALAAAHEVGIVHRDVKPSNILVNSAGEVKLSDFGIARAEADATLTQTGLVTGSPAYLAPEIASGKVATPAADVWSLGATLYHALAGHPPYEVGDNLMGALYRIVHEDPPRIEDPGWLGPVLEHTMTREPEDRWSMAQVRDFLREGPQGVPIEAAPVPGAVPPSDGFTQVLQPTPPEPMAVPPVAPAPAPTPRRPRRNPWPVLIVALAVLLVVGIVWLLASHQDNGSSSAGGPGSPTTTSSRSGSGPDSSSPGSSAPAVSKPTAAGMTSFIENYLATVTSDDRATFAMLTPGFKAQSGNYGGYHGYWSTIASATPSNIHADPANLTVSYDVAYTRTDGSHATGAPTLTLVYRNGKYLIAAEG